MRGLIGPPCQTIITSSFPGRSIGRIVRVGFAFDLDVSLDGRAIRKPQPHFVWCALVIAHFPEESPVVMSLPLKVFLFEPASRLFWMPSSGPLPQSSEDGRVNAFKYAFTYHVSVIVGPASYFWGLDNQSARRPTGPSRL